MTSALKVLLIEDNIDAFAMVKRSLRDTGENRLELKWAQDLTTGLESLGVAAFDAVLLDLNLPDSEGFETFSRVRAAAPASAVIVLTADEDESLALKSVRAGAEEFLLKRDVGSGLLVRRLRYAVERKRATTAAARPPAQHAQVVTLIGAKGGSGTTTLTINLGYALNRHGHTVIGVELGSEPGFSGHISIPSQKHWGLFSDQLEIRPDNLEAGLVRLSRGYDLLCSPGFDSDNSGLDSSKAVRLVEACCSAANYILVDCPSNLNGSTLAVIKESDLCLVLVEPTRLAVHSAKRRIEAILAKGIGSSKLMAIVINKASFVESVSVDSIRTELGLENICVVPPADEQLSFRSPVLAPNEGRIDSRFAETVLQLAARIVERTNGVGVGVVHTSDGSHAAFG